MKRNRVKTGGQILLIPLKAIRENPLRARIYYNDARTDELIRSIGEDGIVEPLTVCAGAKGSYIIISGERRYRAAKALGFDFVPCVLIESDAESSVFTCLSNQLNHDPLTYFEVAICYEKLRDYFGLTYEETAERLGVSLAEVMSKIRLLQIPPKLRKIILEHALSENYAKLLLHHPDDQKEVLLERILRDRLTLYEARALSAEMRGTIRTDRTQIRTYFKDINVFVNTIDRAYAAMRAGGVTARVEKAETDESVEYRISIRKEILTG